MNPARTLLQALIRFRTSVASFRDRGKGLPMKLGAPSIHGPIVDGWDTPNPTCNMDPPSMRLPRHPMPAAPKQKIKIRSLVRAQHMLHIQ